MRSAHARYQQGRWGTSVRRSLERLRQALTAAAGGPRLAPALAGAGPLAWRDPDPPDGSLLMVFGRRKEEPAPEEESRPAPPVAEAKPEDGVPLPQAGEDGLEASDEEPRPDPVRPWTPLEPEAQAGIPDDPEPGPVTLAEDEEQDLPAWGERTFSASPDSAAAASDTPPWAAPDDDDAETFTPAVLDPQAESGAGVSWLQEGAEEPAPWAGAESEEPALAGPSFGAEGSGFEEPAETPAEAPVEPLSAVEPEAPAAPPTYLEPEAQEPEPEPESWAGPETVVAETVIYRAPTEVAVLAPEGPSTRSFPLPEGEVVFRNLRAGFTDPARLLRHLAGEGHTGVMHVQSADGSNGYVVLVDGYVVAVASDRGGTVTTSNRIQFPNFPNSQDTINVISYSRQIARGLALLLHAPVRFQGLGAMFVNLEGLRSYLSKYSCNGGLVVHAQDGVGVALFEDGKLVGGYANNDAPTGDLGQLRELVKDLEAEIDVRFGGPSELTPIPLDTLLAGYPL